MTLRTLLCCCITGIAAGVTAGRAQAAESHPGRPNVVFILADDLGWTDLACYGSRYYETPHIDRLAAQGMRFTQGYTCGPNCQPTRAALMSGQYGPRTGIYTVGGTDRFDTSMRPLVPVENVTKLALVEQLHARLLAWRKEIKAPMPTPRAGLRDRKPGKRAKTGSGARKARRRAKNRAAHGGATP
jgi:hypothetical protein